jgi:phosphatidylglycerol:prolipoprotein diacylglycerol transferase
LGVTFTHPLCQAEPKNIPLFPTQLMEATFIFAIMILLLVYKPYKKFNGQLFITYLILYAIGRSVLEIFRGDLERGFVIKDLVSTSQFISAIVVSVAIYFYVKLRRKATLNHQRK